MKTTKQANQKKSNELRFASIVVKNGVATPVGRLSPNDNKQARLWNEAMKKICQILRLEKCK